MYIQCKVRYQGGGTATLWIEDKLAKKNKKLHDEDMELNCMVDEVYRDSPKTKAEYHKMERMFKSFKDHDGSYK